MRLRNCKRCGQPYETDRPNTYLCPACSLQAKRDSVVRDRTCKACGITFPGGPRAWYCPDCRKERQRAAEKRYKSNGASRPIGSTDICPRCGAEYTVAGGRQRYCPACADQAVKEIVRPHKRSYNKERATELNAHKAEMRKDRKVCTICGAIFDADTPTVTCSPECAKKLRSIWQAKADFKRGKRKTAPKEPPFDIKAARLAKGILRPQLANKIGVSTTTLYLWETGKIKPTEDKLRKLKQILAQYQPKQSIDIKSVRIAKGITQKQLAAEIGVQVGTISNWETGKTQPSQDLMKKTKQILDKLQDRPESILDIRFARKAKGMTQQELADAIGVQHSTVSLWESGKTAPRPETMKKLKAILTGDQKTWEDK